MEENINQPNSNVNPQDLSSTPAQTPQSPTPPTPRSSNVNYLKTISIGMSIVSFCIGIAVIGYLFTSSKNKTSQAPTKQITSTTKPTPTIDPTASWKTYNNTAYGFSIKYPDQIPPDVNTPNQAGEKDVTFIHFLEKQTELGIGPVTGIYIRIYGQNASSNYIVQQKNDYESLFSTSVGEKKQINGTIFTRLPSDELLKDAYIFEERPVPNYPAEIVSYAKGYLIKRNNTLFYIAVVPTKETPSDQYMVYFNEMLSTFKFTQ